MLTHGETIGAFVNLEMRVQFLDSICDKVELELN